MGSLSLFPNQDKVLDFKSTGHILLPFDFSGKQQLIDRILNGFQDFLTLDDNVKDRWAFEVNDDPTDTDQGPDDGYLHRTGEGHDYKSFFHYRPRLRGLLADSAVECAEQNRWLADMHLLHQMCCDKIREFAEVVDGAYPGARAIAALDDCEDMFGHERHVLRLLRYEKHQSTDGVVGKKHSDRGLLTLAVSESHRGLRLFDEHDNPQMYEAVPGMALCFPGLKMQRVSSGLVTPMPHDVIDDTIQGNPGHGRESIVFFAQTNLHLRQ